MNFNEFYLFNNSPFLNKGEITPSKFQMETSDHVEQPDQEEDKSIWEEVMKE